MRTVISKTYHISTFMWYTFLTSILLSKDPKELPQGLFVYGGPWKYLTFLNLVLQMVFFGLAALSDFQLPYMKGEAKKLHLWKDLLFSVLAFPVGSFVVMVFWGMFMYDRQLVYPDNLDNFFPPWINHAMHTAVLPLLAVEIVLHRHAYPKKQNGLATLGIIGVGYLTWVIWIYLTVGVWVYPVLGKFTPAGLAFFFLFNMSVVEGLYLFGEALNCFIWGQPHYKVKRT
ncbi:androgen-dependent TFPI-regulating protein [Lepisosteus oculatus]|uniref:Androgen dependent TFPI regulating protein n=1 Tax=Lepisosteus oculatus TaxID=7918 RepID=W5MMN0_LEPOC|nr:PREDICTED: androgen-dependent TFPI-regulating protein [Lepisosteus oculatus]